jgi:hypothetical protein
MQTIDSQPNKDTDTEEEWTTAKLKDEFFSDMTKVPNTEIFYSDRKYYALAKEIIYKIPVYTKKELIHNIPVYKPAPPTFTFNVSDLGSKCKDEFIEFVTLNSKNDIEFFLKDIAVKFFENIDYFYTHNSVIRHLKVGFND